MPYEKGYAGKVAINGNRKTDIFRGPETKGFVGCCPWYEERVRILEILGVPRKDILTISAEDAYGPKGRQIRWVLTEYGAWVYYWYKRFARS